MVGKRSPLALVLFTVCWGLLQSAAVGEDSILATHRGGVVTSAQVDRRIRDVPLEIKLRIASDEDATGWLLRLVQDLVLQPEMARRARELDLSSTVPGLAQRLANVRTEELVEALRDHVWAECEPAAEQVKEHYERNRGQYRIAAYARVRYIFTDQSNGGLEAARERIERAASFIKSGSDFVDVALACTETGADPEATAEPSHFVLERIQPALREQIERLSAGEISEPFRTRYGYHIVQVVEQHPERMETFEEVADRIGHELRNHCAKTTGEEIDREAAERFPPEVFQESLKSMDGNADDVVVRCGTSAVRLAEFREIEQYERRLQYMHERISVLQLAAYAREQGLAEWPEFRARMREAETVPLSNAYLDHVLSASMSAPTGDEAAAWFAKYRTEYRTPTLTSGGVMEFAAMYPAGSDRRTQFLALQEARRRALAVRERLLAGESFADVAAGIELPDKAETLDYAESHGALFDVHTAPLEPGQVSEPIEKGMSWLLYWKRQVIPARDRTFEEARETVLADMRDYRRNEERKRLEAKILAEIDYRLDDAAVRAYLVRLAAEVKSSLADRAVGG